MISIEQLINSLSNTNFKKINIPNDSEYTQVTYSELQNNKDKLDEIIKQQDELNKIISEGIEYNVIKSENIDGLEKLIKKENIKTYNTSNIKYSSYLEFNENKVINLSEDLNNLLDSLIDVKNINLYGLKNPNSFIKAINLINDNKYLIYNKYEINQNILKTRTEIAVYYKENKKKFVYIPKKDSSGLETLILRDNFYNFGLAQIVSVMHNKNYIILDNIYKKYELYKFSNDNNNNDIYIIIKYDDCNLPLLYGNNVIPFNMEKLIYILNDNNYEMINYKYKNFKIYEDINNNNSYQFNNNLFLNSSLESKINIINQNNTYNNFKPSSLNKSDNKKEDIKEDIKNNITIEKPIEKVSDRKEENKKLSDVVIDYKRYKKEALQRIAMAYNININKINTKTNKTISKTKLELFNDFNNVLYDSKILSKDNF